MQNPQREKIIRKTIERVTTASKVAVFGSNYLMFDKIDDPNCPKCLGGVSDARPTRLNQFTFDLSLEAVQTLSKMGITNNLVYLPVDLIKGVTPERIGKIREEHRIPEEFEKLMRIREFRQNIAKIAKNQQNPKPGEIIYGFESEFRRGAQKILDQIMKKKIEIPTRKTTREDGREIIEALIERLNPIALGIEREGDGPRIAFCQLIFANILRRFEKIGITDLIVYHGEYERICGNQALQIAHRLGLRMNVTMVFFEENADCTFRVTGFDQYPEKLRLALDL